MTGSWFNFQKTKFWKYYILRAVPHWHWHVPVNQEIQLNWSCNKNSILADLQPRSSKKLVGEKKKAGWPSCRYQWLWHLEIHHWMKKCCSKMEVSSHWHFELWTVKFLRVTSGAGTYFIVIVHLTTSVEQWQQWPSSKIHAKKRSRGLVHVRVQFRFCTFSLISVDWTTWTDSQRGQDWTI